jgi:Ca-activated chloride channel homolog
MRFDSPHLLTVIPAAMALLGLFYLWVVRRKARLLDRFGRTAIVRKLTRGVSPLRQHTKFGLVVLGILLVVFSLARPQYGAIERPLRRRGVEVFIAIDCSLSMLSQDIKPSRIERAKQELRGLIQRTEGNNVGIIAFAGIPVVQCPMTSDYDMVLNLLDSIGVDTVPVKGTDLGAAIRKAVGSFKTAGKGCKVLVLLTDGEDLGGDALKAADEAAQAGVVIYAIGIGSPSGAPIPLPQGGFKETEGSKGSSRLDFDTLRKIAVATKGKAILANPTGDLELREVQKSVASLKDMDLKSKALTIHKERFQYFLAIAIIVLGGEMLLSDRKRRIEAGGAGRYD